MPESPASNAKVKPGDVILSINGQTFENIEQIQNIANENIDQELTYQLSRLGEEKEIKVTPELREQTQKGGIGISVTKTGIVSYPWYQAIWMGIKGTFILIREILLAFYKLLASVVTKEKIGMEIAGPVGIAVMTGQVARMGLVYLMQFTAILSINLAIINFLPLPALDGGRFLFIIIEKIRRKPVNQKIEAIVHTIGFALLMLLVLVVTFKDIYKFKQSFIDLWQKVVG